MAGFGDLRALERQQQQTSRTAVKKTAVSVVPPKAVKPAKKKKKKTYTVRKNDTWQSAAGALGVDPVELIQANPIMNLKAGQVLTPPRPLAPPRLPAPPPPPQTPAQTYNAYVPMLAPMTAGASAARPYDYTGYVPATGTTMRPGGVSGVLSPIDIFYGGVPPLRQGVSEVWGPGGTVGVRPSGYNVYDIPRLPDEYAPSPTQLPDTWTQGIPRTQANMRAQLLAGQRPATISAYDAGLAQLDEATLAGLGYARQPHGGYAARPVVESPARPTSGGGGAGGSSGGGRGGGGGGGPAPGGGSFGYARGQTAASINQDAGPSRPLSYGQSASTGRGPAFAGPTGRRLDQISLGFISWRI